MLISQALMGLNKLQFYIWKSGSLIKHLHWSILHICKYDFKLKLFTPLQLEPNELPNFGQNGVQSTGIQDSI